jgi:hypothetical protein
MLTRQTDYDRLYRDFAWQVPDRYNIGVDTCDKHADGSFRLALISVADSGEATEFSFDYFRQQSNRFANVLVAHGFNAGDRLAILLQSLDCPTPRHNRVTRSRSANPGFRKKPPGSSRISAACGIRGRIANDRDRKDHPATTARTRLTPTALRLSLREA